MMLRFSASDRHARSLDASGRRGWKCLGRAAALLTVATLLGCGGSSGGRSLQVSGSTTVGPIVADAAETLRGSGIDVIVDTLGGSAGGIAQLAAGEIDVAMSSAPISEADRTLHPTVAFASYEIGVDAVGVIVHRDVYDGGVTDLTRDQVRALFQGEVDNWSELGGPDIPVYLIDKEPGRGTREVLTKWLYDGGQPPPPPDMANYSVIGGNEEGLAKLSSTPGSVGPLSTAFIADSQDLVAIALDGVSPSVEAIASGEYPLARPLLLVTNGTAVDETAQLLEFLVSADGQQLVERHGYLTLDRLGIDPAVVLAGGQSGQEESS